MQTSTDRQDFDYGQFAVIRRFKDFEWLSHRLEEEFPGIVMPALPVKAVVGKFDQTFVEVSSSGEWVASALRGVRENSHGGSHSPCRADELLKKEGSWVFVQ